MSYTISKQDMTTLLGRSLSDSETANYDNLLAAAKSRMEVELNCRIDANANETSRKYRANRDFRQLFIDPFTNLTSAKIDGVEDLDAMAMNGDNFSGSWFNSVVFSQKMRGRIVEITAYWGFGAVFPAELQILWAQIFDAVANSSARDENGRFLGDISSESILSHSISYGNSGATDDFAKIFAKNVAVIEKYRLPDNIRVDSLENCEDRRFYDL